MATANDSSPTVPYAYITNSKGTVSVIDTATDTVIATVNVGEQPVGVAVNPQGTRVYVANLDNHNISVIDTAINTVIATVNVGNTPSGVAVNPQGTKVYVTNNGDNTVSVIDTATNNVTDTVSVGNLPQGVAVNPDGTKVYVTNLEGTVSAIDTNTDTVTSTFNVGRYPYGVAITPDAVNVESGPSGVSITPDGKKVYVVNHNDKTVSVINTASNTITATVPVEYYPSAFGQFIIPVQSQSSSDSGAAVEIVAVEVSDLVVVWASAVDHPNLKKMLKQKNSHRLLSEVGSLLSLSSRRKLLLLYPLASIQRKQLGR
jgi:YVTN family beta-propeller protein